MTRLPSTTGTAQDADISLPECRPLIISGPPRSGTSLLYNLFDGHPAVSWLVSEGFLFEYLYDLGPSGARLFVEASRRPVDEIIEGIRSKDVMPPLHLGYQQDERHGSVSSVKVNVPWSEPAFRAALQGKEVSSVRELWVWLVKAYLAAMGEKPKQYACLKSPDYGKSATAACTHIPETRAILIVRDPVYALDSLKRSRHLRGEKLLTWPILAGCVAEMNAMVERAQCVGSQCLTWLRYEDLVTNPVTIMKDLAQWLGIEYRDCLVEPTMLGQSWPGISSFASTQGIEQTPKTRQIMTLTKPEIDFVNHNIGPFRRHFGYDASS